MSTFAAEFRAFETALNGGTRQWTHALRRRGMAAYESLGPPTAKLESWKHTTIAPLLAGSPAWVKQAVRLPRREELTGLALPGVPRLVLVDGVLAPELSDPLGAGLRVESIEAAAARAPLLEPHLGRLAPDSDALVALNTAFLSSGVVLHVTGASAPLHLVWISTAGAAPTVRHPRCLVVAESHSRATLYESWVGQGEGEYLTNSVTEVALASGAELELVRLVAEGAAGSHVNATEARLMQGARFTSRLFCLGGKLVRQALTVRLLGEGAEAVLDGLYLGDGREHVDNTTTIEHAVPRCTSRERYKGVLAGSASSIFYGKVIVQKHAQKSDASQQNRNLVLSKSAQANTRPQLEIYADDVKCAHGATVGQLDDDQLYYLRSRGIGLEEARRELTYAFAKEIIDSAPQLVRAQLEARVQARLGRPA